MTHLENSYYQYENEIYLMPSTKNYRTWYNLKANAATENRHQKNCIMHCLISLLIDLTTFD